MQLCGIFEIKRGKNQQTFFSHTKSVNKTAFFVASHDLNHLCIAPACPKVFAMSMFLTSFTGFSALIKFFKMDSVRLGVVESERQRAQSRYNVRYMLKPSS